MDCSTISMLSGQQLFKKSVLSYPLMPLHIVSWTYSCICSNGLLQHINFFSQLFTVQRLISSSTVTHTIVYPPLYNHPWWRERRSSGQHPAILKSQFHFHTCGTCNYEHLMDNSLYFLIQSAFQYECQSSLDHIHDLWIIRHSNLNWFN